MGSFPETYIDPLFNSPQLQHDSGAFWSFFFLFGLVVFVLKSHLGIARQYRVECENFAVGTLKSRSHVRILI